MESKTTKIQNISECHRNLVKVATSWPFITSLALLTLNDYYLKYAFGNWLTGKLSDFSGLFFVTMLFCTFFPRSKTVVSAVLAITFAAWKSPISDPLIAILQSLGFGWFGRVVDYTDLIALIVLPFASKVTARVFRQNSRAGKERKYLALPILCAAALAVAATSTAPALYDFTIRKVDTGQQFDVAKVTAIIRKVVEKEKLKCVACDNPNKQAIYEREALKLEYRIENQSAITFKIDDLYDGASHSIVREIKNEFGKNFEDVEYVIPLASHVVDIRK